MSTELFLSVGEHSGDHHAARLITDLKARVPDLRCTGLGGPAMAAAGAQLLDDIVGRAIFGIGGAVKELPRALALLRRVAGALDASPPKAVVLVDYPGLNLFVARLAHRRGIPVIYFVAPQLWAWAPWRARRFARVIDAAYVIFPFEEGFWRSVGVDATYIGHPALEQLPKDAFDPAIANAGRPVALLPGSRKREVRDHMPILLETARHVLHQRPEVTFHSAHVSRESRGRMAALAEAAGVPLQLHDDRVHAVMASCRCAVVASGTATMETAAFGTPQVVVYRLTSFETTMGRWLIIPEDICQVNLAAGKPLCPEFKERNPNPAEVAMALMPFVDDTRAYERNKEDLAALRAELDGRDVIGKAAELLAARLG